MPFDKILHLLAGVIVAAVVGCVCKNVAYGLAASVLAGILKEVRDWHVYRGFDVWDMIATWCGGLAVYIIAEAIK